MKIKEIIIEGFKSYQKQVILTDFDPQFNALTGENGSGKSNILEAIFFGIGFNFRNSKLNRVANPRDLIYQRGQGGIQKAKVILKFCNKDKSKSPVGYEGFDQLILERTINSIDNKSKFRLNQVNKNASQIKSIFKSIRLNIDNFSTFFVQQGKVAEIVKFHPQELMKFVEETAGVSYFNSVKEDTVKNIDQSEPKLNSCLESVGKLQEKQEALKKELQIYKNYKHLQQQFNKIVAQKEFYQRKQGREDLIKIQKELKILQEQDENLKIKINDNNKLLESKKFALNQFLKDEKKEANKELEQKQQELTNQLNDFQIDIKQLKIEIEDLKKDKQKVYENNLNKQAQREEKKNLLEQLQKQLQNYSREEQKLKIEKKDLEVHITNKQSNSDQNKFIKQKFEQSKQNCLSIQDKIKNEQEKVKTLQSNLEEFKNQLALKNSNYESLIKKHEKQLKQKQDLEIRSDEIFQSKKQLKNIKDQKNQYENQIKNLDDQFQREFGKLLHKLDIQNLHRIQQKFNRTEFFKKVHNIINVKKPEQFNNPLEIIAGNKLFYYVTRDQNIMTELINEKLINGDIKVIPNNQIIYHTHTREQIQLAKQIAKQMNEEVWTPQELIEYPKELERTINYVFQNMMVCSSSKVAKVICYDEPRLKLPCITLDGDNYSPSGSLSGGYRLNRISFLEQSQKFKSKIKEKKYLKEQYFKIQQKENQLLDIYEKDRKIKDLLYQTNQKLLDIENKLKSLQLEKLKNQIEASQIQIKFSEEELVNLNQKLQDFKRVKQNYKNQLSDKKNSNQKNFLQERLNEIIQQYEKIQESIQQTQNKIKQTQLFLQSVNEKEQNTEQKKQKIENDILNKNKELTVKEKQKDQFQKNLEEVLQQIYQEQFQQNFLREKENDLKYQIQDLSQRIEEDKQQLINFKEDIQNKINYQIQLEQMFKGKNRRKINQVEAEFDQEGEITENIGDIINKLKNEIQQNQDEQEKIKKFVNFDIEEIYNKVEQELQQYIHYKEELLRNKATLKNAIQSLTQKSYETVLLCFEKVNENLGNIFSTLLPGTFAKMEMTDFFNKKKKQNEKGIQIKVKIGQQWKKSLGELSGGQRTLLALAFLLSLLKYNSAPFYIFDEVDAALDQSHTENLGLIISKYFSESQFFVISLKEGFYKNANVLFRTSQINGFSTIERINMKNKKKMKFDKKIDFN